MRTSKNAELKDQYSSLVCLKKDYYENLLKEVRLLKRQLRMKRRGKNDFTRGAKAH